jgi:hypothetical protein
MSRPAAMAFAAVAAFASGCHRSSDPADTAASGTASPAKPPVDHLAPGELIEGPDTAFGVHLPRGLAIETSIRQEIAAAGPLPIDALVRYFRAHLEQGGLREGPVSATFEHVKAPGGAGPMMTIRIARVRDRSEVTFDNETPPPVPDLPDEAARWRHVGLTPNGKLLDPTHLD